MKLGDKPWYAIAMGRKALFCAFMAGFFLALTLANVIDRPPVATPSHDFRLYLFVSLATVFAGAAWFFAGIAQKALVTCVMELWKGWDPGFKF